MMKKNQQFDSILMSLARIQYSISNIVFHINRQDMYIQLITLDVIYMHLILNYIIHKI